MFKGLLLLLSADFIFVV